jgi:hypothetical protein
MAVVDLTVQQVVRAGLTAVYTGSMLTTNTYTFTNDGRVVCHFKKSAAVNCNATIVTPNTVDGLAIADRVVQVLATTGDKFIGPFPTKDYNDGSDKVTMSYSDVDGLTVAVLRV